MTASVNSLIARMEDAERRLAEHAASPPPTALSDPDPGGEERWEAGQVWAHLAEFPAFWLEQLRGVVEGGTDAPVPFGRVKTDPARIEAIERERHTDPAALLERVRASLAQVSDAVRTFSDEQWRARGVHPTLGEMNAERIVERFIVGHLEEHAAQLDSIASR